ncbi:DUF998 domain-containing protein [Hymenobacter sp. HD11105]
MQLKRSTKMTGRGTWNNYALAGLVAPATFLLAYLVLSSLRPEYSLYTKAISELGSVDAPRAGAWNLFGYVVPGALVAVFAFGLYRDVSPGRRGRTWPLAGLFLSGVCMAFSGIFPGDFDNRQALTMRLHTASSVGSYLFFLLGAFTFPLTMAQSPYWQKTSKPTIFFAGLTILFGAWPVAFPAQPAVGQRLVFLVYFFSVGYLAYQLLTKPTQGATR